MGASAIECTGSPPTGAGQLMNRAGAAPVFRAQGKFPAALTPEDRTGKLPYPIPARRCRGKIIQPDAKTQS